MNHADKAVIDTVGLDIIKALEPLGDRMGAAVVALSMVIGFIIRETDNPEFHKSVANMTIDTILEKKGGAA